MGAYRYPLETSSTIVSYRLKDIKYLNCCFVFIFLTLKDATLPAQESVFDIYIDAVGVAGYFPELKLDWFWGILISYETRQEFWNNIRRDACNKMDYIYINIYIYIYIKLYQDFYIYLHIASSSDVLSIVRRQSITWPYDNL